MKKKATKKVNDIKGIKAPSVEVANYGAVLNGVVELLESARRTSARATNAIMTATYWEVGRRIVESEQGGKSRAEYGDSIIERLSSDLSDRVGRGYSARNLRQMRAFYLGWQIWQTVSAKSVSTEKTQSLCAILGDVSKGQTPTDQSPRKIQQTLSAESDQAKIEQTVSSRSQENPTFQTGSGKVDVSQIAARFPLPWSHYVLLLKVDNPDARRFYETEALRGGWSVRQLDRQVSTLFFERTLASKNKKAMLEKGSVPEASDLLTAEQEIKDPLVLEFLGLSDEYSETDLENALIEHLETFLLELGGDFTFVGRQRRLRIDDEWYRIDLLFFHRVLRCLVVIDLKLGKFTHADAGQMMLYLGYAAEHWTRPGENPPVGLILCSQHNRAVAHYTIDRFNDKVLAAEYRLALPDEKILVAEVERTQAAIEQRTPIINTKKAKPTAKKTKRK